MIEPGKVVLTRRGCVRGAREILPLCTFVFVLAATFGVAARQAGLSISLASMMSALVFAGGAQFAALALLGPPPAMMPILLGTLAINARHLLLGAALAPWLLQLPRWKRLSSVAVMSDANWAQAMRAYASGERDAGVLSGAGITMWITWVIGTATGALVSTAVPDVRALWPGCAAGWLLCRGDDRRLARQEGRTRGDRRRRRDARDAGGRRARLEHSDWRGRRRRRRSMERCAHSLSCGRSWSGCRSSPT